MMETLKLTKSQYESIHRDYRGVWTTPSSPDLVGKRTVFENSARRAAGLPLSDGPIRLLLEGVHFEITN